MGKYNYRDKYGRLDESIDNVAFFSALSATAYDQRTRFVYTRTNPAKSHGVIDLKRNSGVTKNVFSGGIHTGSIVTEASANYNYLHMIGSGMDSTIWNKNINAYGEGSVWQNSLYFYDMTVRHISQPLYRTGYIFVGCTIYSDLSGTKHSCKLYAKTSTNGGNSFINVPDAVLSNTNLDLFDHCKVTILSSDVSGYRNNFVAFNDCELKIGAETEYKALNGNTEEELRADFVARCEAQSITVPNVTDMGETMKQGKWIFSKNSCVDGLVKKDSALHNYEKRHLVYFGYSFDRCDAIGITSDKSKSASFSPVYANSSLTITDGSIALASNIDVSQAVAGECATNIIWLGGKYQLNKLDIIHNLPVDQGVSIDSTPSLSSVEVNKDGGIVPYSNGVHRAYIVRSKDGQEAKVKYNGVTYSSAVISRNNIFNGVAGVTSFVPETSNAIVYEVLDKVLHSTVQMRIVNKIPSGVIASGSLQAGYWYFVEPKLVSDASGSVTYNGITYPAYSSFVAEAGKSTFTLTGNVQLRRCWKDLYNEADTDATDKAFWQNEQKPKWFDVLPNDLRCLMSLNNAQQAEMQRDKAGNYIASGHPDFYNSVLAMSGNPGELAFPIKGAFMQLRLKITTQNPI